VLANYDFVSKIKIIVSVHVI